MLHGLVLHPGPDPTLNLIQTQTRTEDAKDRESSDETFIKQVEMGNPLPIPVRFSNLRGKDD